MVESNIPFHDALVKAGLDRRFQEYGKAHPELNWREKAEVFGYSSDWQRGDKVNEPPPEIAPELTNEDIGSAMRWALQHIGDAYLDVEDAPNPMAFAFWQWSSEAKSKGMELFLRFLGQQKGDAAKEKRVLEDDKRDQLKRLQALTVTCPHCGEVVE